MHHNKKFWLFGGLLCAFGGMGVARAALNPHESKSDRLLRQSLGAEAVPGEFVVKFRRNSGVSTQAVTRSLSTLGLKVRETINAGERLYLTKVRDPQTLGVANARDLEAYRAAAILRITSLPEVEYAEPNFIYHTQQESIQIVPDDTSFGEQWALKNTGQNDSEGKAGVAGADIRAPRAWGLGQGSSEVVVAVIDTGVNYKHPDLKTNIWTKPAAAGETPSEIHGYNAMTGKFDPMDDNGHGSHCAGVIGATPNNGVGIAGLNWNVRIMGVKFLNSGGGGSLGDAVKAIDWAVANGAQILSNSWGGGGFSQAIYDAIDRARAKGILFVAAAGNDGADNDRRPGYPASYNLDNIISVAATTNRDELASFSNFGKRSVHIAAPGQNILSTILGDKYESMSGTSMAAPHVAGAAALLLGRDAHLTPTQVRTRIMESSDKIPTLRRKIASGGRLNIYNMLAGVTGPGLVEVPESSWSDTVEHVVESAHPYANGSDQEWVIEHPGATFIRVRFEKLALEEGYDSLEVRSGTGEVIDTISGTPADGTWSESVPGDKVILKLKTDSSVSEYGFKVNSYAWTNFAAAAPVPAHVRASTR
jgi:thermitase